MGTRSRSPSFRPLYTLKKNRFGLLQINKMQRDTQNCSSCLDSAARITTREGKGEMPPHEILKWTIDSPLLWGKITAGEHGRRAWAATDVLLYDAQGPDLRTKGHPTVFTIIHLDSWRGLCYAVCKHTPFCQMLPGCHSFSSETQKVDRAAITLWKGKDAEAFLQAQ